MKTQKWIRPCAKIALAAALFIALGAGPSLAQGASVDDLTGPYAGFGFSIGETNGDDGAGDSEVQGGFNLRGGYRLNEWIAGEAAFIFVSDAKDDVDYFSFTFGPKIYPLGLLAEPILPKQIQPYTTIAIGGGEYILDDTRESTFIARFMFGFDYWLTGNIGAWMEGGYHVSDEDSVEGTGIFAVGGQYRF